MRNPKHPFLAFSALALLTTVSGLATAQELGERDPALTDALERGKTAMAEENWDEALSIFEEAKQLDADRTFAELYFWTGEALRQLEDYSNAGANYQQAVRVQNDFAAAYNGLGVCWKEQGQFDVARTQFENAVTFDRRNADASANLGDLLVNIFQDPVEGMGYLDRAIELNPQDAEAYRNRGVAHAMLQEYEEGIADLNKSAELEPSEYKTYERLASVYQAEEDLPASIDALTRAIDLYEPEESSEPETFINGYLRRASLRMSLSKEEDQTAESRNELYDLVVADSEAVLEEFPDRVPESGIALYRLGTAKRMQELYEDAITALTDAIQLASAGRESDYIGQAYLLRGICWFYQGQNSLARGDFKESASRSFSDPLPYLWIGFTQAKEGDYRKAIESYGEAAAKSPTFALAYVNRGLAYMQLGDFEKASDNFDKAIRAEPTEANHYYKSGRARELLEMFEEARSFYFLALRRDENHVAAHRGAARALRALGKPNLAENHERRAAEIEASNEP